MSAGGALDLADTRLPLTLERDEIGDTYRMLCDLCHSVGNVWMRVPWKRQRIPGTYFACSARV